MKQYDLNDFLIDACKIGHKELVVQLIINKDNYPSMSHYPSKEERELLIQLDKIIGTTHE